MSKPMSIVERARLAAKKQAAAEASGNHRKYSTTLPPFQMKLSEDGKKTLLRVVPYTITDPRGNPDEDTVGAVWYKRRYYTHYINGTSVICPNKTFRKPCPVCEQRQKLYASGENDAARALLARERELMNVYNYAEKKLQLLDESTHTFGRALQKEINDPDNEGAEYFVSPDKDGKNLSLRFDVTGQMGGRDIIGLGNARFPDAKEALADELLAQAVDLDACLIETSYEELQAMLGAAAATAAVKAPAEDTDSDAPSTAAPAADKPIVQPTVNDVDDLADSF